MKYIKISPNFWKKLQKGNIFKAKMEYTFMFNKLDKNQKILEILKENSKLSTSKISKKTGIPITTIHNRIKKMEKEGIIKKYTLTLDHKKLGKPIMTFIFMNPDYHFLKSKKMTQQDLIKNLSKLPHIEEIYHITGRYDIIAKVRVKDIEELNEFTLNILEKNYGIMKTETMLVLSEVSE